MKRKIKIFDYTWHVPHQFDMIYALREDCEFYFCLNAKKQWDLTQRPVPANLKFVSHYEKGCYDVAILHIDQQIITPGNIKRIIYEQFDKIITDIPKIVINHGTPVFPEGFMDLRYTMSNAEMEQQCVDIVKKLIGDKLMIVNSYQAASDAEWGFGYPIVHGINSADWLDLPKEPRVFTAMSAYGFHTYYNRKCMLAVSDILFTKYGYTLAYAKLNVQTDRSLSDYKTYLGQSLLYLDTSFRTPMNRARTEAFLSGCCVIQVAGAHDLEFWAKDGENIIIVPNDPQIIAERVAGLLNNGYQQAWEIGQKGKKMAEARFNPSRYRNDWLSVLDRMLTSNVTTS